MSSDDASPTIRIETVVYADYLQFYVQDPQSTCDTSLIWDDPATTEHGFALGDGLVAIGTKRYGDVPVVIEVLHGEPKLDWHGIDRVNEGGIVVTNGLSYGMPISEMRPIEGVAPGTYAVRSLARGLATVVDDWQGDDHYTVQLWPVDELRPARYLTKPGS